ncbi:MAG: hypothetical protein ACI8XM_000249 [Haloarculaceae archaeon]|jgi:hypothetical protein
MSGMATAIDAQTEALDEDGVESFFVGGENAGVGGEAAPAYDPDPPGWMEQNKYAVGGVVVALLVVMAVSGGA